MAGAVIGEHTVDLGEQAGLGLELSGGGGVEQGRVGGGVPQKEAQAAGELIEPSEGWRIINGYTLAFALHTLGEPGLEGILDGTSSLGDAAVISP